jgi:hypothetical protein
MAAEDTLYCPERTLAVKLAILSARSAALDCISCDGPERLTSSWLEEDAGVTDVLLVPVVAEFLTLASSPDEAGELIGLESVIRIWFGVSESERSRARMNAFSP